MEYYSDYEALEFEADKAVERGIFPYYLNLKTAKEVYNNKVLCPIFHSLCDVKGNIIQSQEKNVSFMDVMNLIKRKHKKQKEHFIWYHNIQFDFRIIVYELFYCGFQHVFDSSSIEYTGGKKIEEYDITEDLKAFSIIGENLSKYIGVNIYYSGYIFRIRDTYRIISSAQDKILREFGFTEKVKIDWNKITLENLDENMPLIKERCEYDVISLSKAMEQFKAEFKERYSADGKTAASISLSAFKYYTYIEHTKTINPELIEGNKVHQKVDNLFNTIYPKLEHNAKEISIGCYHGGICTVNKKYAGKELKNVLNLDINSSYPYSMTCPLPYGEPELLNNILDESEVYHIGDKLDKEYKYAEYVLFIKYHFNGIPFARAHSENRARQQMNMQLKDPKQIYSRSEFPQEFEGYICINSIDLSTLKKYAIIDFIHFEKGYVYNTNLLLKGFIEPLYEQRKIAEPIHKNAIKLILNSLYGKFAQDLSGQVFQYSDIQKYEKFQAIDTEYHYKPLASAVTAYSRQNWVITCYALGDDFIYGDTDSVYFFNNKKSMSIVENAGIVDSKQLGKWKFEYEKPFKKAKFLSKKNYILELHDGKIKVTCVGLSHRYHHLINFENFKLDSEVIEVEKMVNIYGGKAMRKIPFKIHERYIG